MSGFARRTWKILFVAIGKKGLDITQESATYGSIMTGGELRGLRERLEMTQTELGEALGMQRNSITRMELGLMPIRKVTELAVNHLAAMKFKKGGRTKWR